LEIDVLTAVWREIARQLELAEIEAEAPDRIQQIQPAVLRFD
jgi:hypothetical protein